MIHEGTQLCRREDVERLLPRVTAETRPLPSAYRAESGSPVAPLIDVVCGTEFDPALAPFATVHDGLPYRFCSLACQRQFEAQPERYAARVDDLSASRG